MNLESRAAPAYPARLAGAVPRPDAIDPADAVTALYREHALGMIRLAHVMLGNRAQAEDVVQEAFLGLFRRWDHLDNKDSALGYVRTSVLNGCRSVLRLAGPPGQPQRQAPAISAESEVLSMQERSEVVTALRQLATRQQEVLVLGYYLDLSDGQIAADLGITKVTVRSTRHRALAALGRALREKP